METRALDTTGPRFLLDEDVIPETATARLSYANHGRAIARNRHGLWFCVFVFDRRYRDRTWVALAVSPTPAADGSSFAAPLMLVGHADAPWRVPLFESGEGLPGNALGLVDAQDRLHVLYDHPAGVFRLTADASGTDAPARLASAAAWSGPERIAEAGSSLGDAAELPSGEIAVYVLRGGALFECVGSTATPVTENAERPSVFVSDAGVRHVAFERRRRVFYTRSTDGRRWTDAAGRTGAEMVAYFCSSWPSLAVDAAGRVVIAYQGEGKVELKRNRALYNQIRGAGGATVSYAVHSGGRWEVQDFLRSSEILLKRRPSHSVPTMDDTFVPFMEEFWRPGLAVDRHGVIWMFYPNTTRRHVFFTRFGGETFGDHHEARGPYDALSRTVFVQKDARRSDAIGVLTRAAHQLYFDAIPVPGYRNADARRVVFLDNLELAEWSGVEHRLGQWQKHPARVFGFGVSGDTEDDHVCWCGVRSVPGGFEMHYAGQGGLYRNSMPGRAVSGDGLCWQKQPPVDESALTLDGQPLPSRFWRPIFLEDAGDPDPVRRYKGMLACYRHVQGLEIRSWEVVTSPDAVHWRRMPGLEPVLVGDISVEFHLLRDDEDTDPRRRYKAVMLSACAAGRNALVYTSPDLIHWHGAYHLRLDPESVVSALSPYQTGPVVLDPDAAENPWEEEIHDACLWRENGLLMFHYDAFYFGGNQHINKALAMSRDGKHYWRVKRGAFNLQHGHCGEWDSGRDRTSPPVRVGDELRLYFAGMPAGNFADPDVDDPMTVKAGAPSPDDNRRGRELRPWSVGLARLRADGWAWLRLNPDREAGAVTTIPFEYTGGTLVVNGTGLGPGGLTVEVRTADNRGVVPGYAADCCTFSAADAVSARVAWPGAAPLVPGEYRLRFLFAAVKARLYAFGFQPA